LGNLGGGAPRENIGGKDWEIVKTGSQFRPQKEPLSPGNKETWEKKPLKEIKRPGLKGPTHWRGIPQWPK